jgi:hypothetical protein
MKYHIIDKQDRGVLSEGRSKGMGFAFAKVVDGTYGTDCVALETIQPVSPCKDYLNDVVWSEATEKTFYAWGLHTNPLGIFKHGVGFMVMRICGSGARTPAKYASMDKDIAAFDNNLGEIERSINVIEKGLGLGEDNRTKFNRAEGCFVALIPLFWCEATYRISLWSLLTRALLHKSDAKDPIKYLEKLGGEDSMLLNGDDAGIPKLKLMLAGNIPSQDLSKLSQPHNEGIVSFKF